MNNKWILLVEDDRFLRKACEASLRRQGYEVRSAQDGEEALQIAREARPSLILLDLLMPKVTGLEALEALKADNNLRDVPVVILSNSSAEGQMQKARSLGIAGYFVKAELSLKELGDRVKVLLEA